MERKLIQNGNDYALVISADIIEKLNFTQETVFNLSIDGKNLVFSPNIENIEYQDITQSLKTVNQKYGDVLKRLGE